MRQHLPLALLKLFLACPLVEGATALYSLARFVHNLAGV